MTTLAIATRRIADTAGFLTLPRLSLVCIFMSLLIAVVR